ncbi:hypothetical protein M3Y99_01885400 [Aphelenchoides fujianensis]|nr:hypothetical protein M3Y99_01885400 [Aphelenchoides fujianensis]
MPSEPPTVSLEFRRKADGADGAMVIRSSFPCIVKGAGGERAATGLTPTGEEANESATVDLPNAPANAACVDDDEEMDVPAPRSVPYDELALLHLRQEREAATRPFANDDASLSYSSSSDEDDNSELQDSFEEYEVVVELSGADDSSDFAAFLRWLEGADGVEGPADADHFSMNTALDEDEPAASEWLGETDPLLDNAHAGMTAAAETAVSFAFDTSTAPVRFDLDDLIEAQLQAMTAELPTSADDALNADVELDEHEEVAEGFFDNSRVQPGASSSDASNALFGGNPFVRCWCGGGHRMVSSPECPRHAPAPRDNRNGEFTDIADGSREHVGRGDGGNVPASALANRNVRNDHLLDEATHRDERERFIVPLPSLRSHLRRSFPELEFGETSRRRTEGTIECSDRDRADEGDHDRSDGRLGLWEVLETLELHVMEAILIRNRALQLRSAPLYRRFPDSN